jgi:hypothetical protein
MSMSNPQDKQNVQDVREKAREIGQRAKNDPQFMQEIKQDPMSTLEKAGLPQGAAADVVREEEGAEVSGYRLNDCTITCVSTNCCITI